MLTNSSRRSENEVQIYACNAQIAYIDNTKSRARRYTSKRVRLGNMYIPIGTLFSKKYLHPTLKESSTISAMSMSTGKDVIVATTHFLMEPTLLGSTKVMTLALSYEV